MIHKYNLTKLDAKLVMQHQLNFKVTGAFAKFNQKLVTFLCKNGHDCS